MMSPSSPTGADMNALPQYGFGPEVSFENLLSGNPFLYRVYTPRAHSHQPDNATPPFVGNKYGDEVAGPSHCSSPEAASSYADVVQHMDWTSRSTSPCISTSFSFAWTIWEAIRRYHNNVKHDVEIAVIDARAVADHAVTAVELLMKGAPKDRHKDHWKWYRFALESQDVLVRGHIPESAVLASIPLLHILNRLPSYFLCHDINDPKNSTLFKLGWDYTRKKPNYRQFCQVISDRFLQMPMEKRLRDTTAGSVRLAVALLRPYFHKHISDDFTTATGRVYDLAYVIAQWPGQWWSREHPEIRELIRCVVHMIGEEMREAKRVQALADATRMQEIVGGLDQLVQAYETRSRPRKLLADMALSPSPSLSPTLPPSPTREHKQALRLGSLDIVTDDMIEIKAPELEVNAPELEVLAQVESAAVEIVAEEIRYSVQEKAPQTPSATSWALEAAARTTSCFLTGLLVGSFIALCVLAPDRRQLAHHLT